MAGDVSAISDVLPLLSTKLLLHLAVSPHSMHALCVILIVFFFLVLSFWLVRQPKHMRAQTGDRPLCAKPPKPSKGYGHEHDAHFPHGSVNSSPFNSNRRLAAAHARLAK